MNKLKKIALITVALTLAAFQPVGASAENADGRFLAPRETARDSEEPPFRSRGEDELSPEIRDGLLTGVRIGTPDEFVSVGEVADMYRGATSGTVTVEKADGSLAAPEAPIGTGDVVAVVLPDGRELKGAVLIPGDALGTGLVSISQVVRIGKAVSGQEPLFGVYLQAADLNRSGAADVSDLALAARLLADPTAPLPSDPGKPEEPELPSGPAADEICLQASRRIIERMNEFRASRGMAPLPMNPVLTEGAQRRADEVAETDVFSHTRPNGEPYYTARAWPEGWQARGENLGFLRSISGLNATEIGDRLFEHLSESADHEAIMLNPKYSMGGVAVAFAKNGSAFAAQWFAG